MNISKINTQEADVFKPLIDLTLFNPTGEELVWLKSAIGIEDEHQLREHIVTLQAKAYKIYPYPCIRFFNFIRLRIARHKKYPRVLELGRTRPGAIFLEIGCCFGTDIRKAIADGYPVDNVIATDLRAGFWILGHELFRDTPESFKVPFIEGDALDASHLEIVPPSSASPQTRPPELSSITSLNPLHGHVSVIHASAFFHLFNEAHQTELARAMAGLLSPEPGSIIFGGHMGRPEKGFRPDEQASNGLKMFCHGPQSWTEMWDGGVFKKGEVNVETRLVAFDLVGMSRNDIKAVSSEYILQWSVTRV